MPPTKRTTTGKKPRKKTTKKVRSAKNRDDELATYRAENATDFDLDQYIKFTGGSLSAAIKLIETSDKRECIARAQSNKEDDLIGAILDTKVDFYSAGMTVETTSGKGRKDEVKSRINKAVERYQLVKLGEELIEDWENCDNCILQWKINKGKIEYIHTIDPQRARYSNAIGHERLSVKISEEMVKHIQNEIQLGNEKELRRSVPEKYIKAVKDGTYEVTLSNEDGEYWIVRTKGRKYTGFAMPSQKRVFMDIILRRLLISGDWTLAYFVKRIIEIIRAGESVQAGQKAGTKALYITKEDRTQLENIFKNNSSQALRLFANHTVDVKHIAPDPELFTEQKFTKVEERIFRWGSVIDTIMTGEGDGFAQSTLGVRRFVAHGRRARRTVGGMLEGFFEHPSVTVVLGLKGDIQVKVSWDEQNLKDDAQILSELTALADRGAMDVQTMIERLGHKYAVIEGRKKEQKKKSDFWVPNYEPRQGLLQYFMGLVDAENRTNAQNDKKEDGPGRKRKKEMKSEPDNKPRPSRTRS